MIEKYNYNVAKVEKLSNRIQLLKRKLKFTEEQLLNELCCCNKCKFINNKIIKSCLYPIWKEKGNAEMINQMLKSYKCPYYKERSV